MPTDPMWCFERYGEAAEYIDQLENQRDELLAKLDRAQAEITQLNQTIAALTKEGRDAAEM